MRSSKLLLFLLLLAWEGLGSRPLRAQCLPLGRLRAGVVAGRITPDSLRALLPPNEWTLHPGDSPYWTHRAPGQLPGDEEDGTEAWVGLRRSNNQGFYDVVYKTTRRECITQLRAELRRHTKLKSEYVNCVQCEAERLMGEGFTVTIFNQKANYAAQRTPYPFVLVLRRATSGASTGASAADASVGQTEDGR